MRNLAAAFFFFTVFHSFGQTSTSSDTLHWNANRHLTFADFKGDPIEGVGLSGEVFCMNLANFVKPSVFQKTKFTVVSVFDKNKSWMSQEVKSEQTLSYFQVMYNIYEVHAR